MRKENCGRSLVAGILAGLIVIGGCELKKGRGPAEAPSKVDQVAARAGNELAFEGSEVYLSIIPVDVNPSATDPVEARLCIYQVNFWRGTLEDGSKSSEVEGALELLRRTITPLSAFAYAPQDVEALSTEMADQIKMAKDEAAACLTEAREKAERAFQRIIAGVGVPSAFQGCPTMASRGRIGTMWQDFLGRFQQRTKRETAAVVGPIKPLLERTLDVTQVEPLPAAEYLLILDRIKRHSLFHDLAAAKKARSAPGSVTTCYDKPFDLDRYKNTLSAIAEAFPPARKVPQIKL